MVMPPPNGERIARRNLLQESLGEELGDDLLGCAALEVRGKLDPAVLALRGGGQDDELGIGEFHGILRSVATAKAPSPPKPRSGDGAGGVGSRDAVNVQGLDSTARFGADCQSILDNLLAKFAS